MSKEWDGSRSIGMGDREPAMPNESAERLEREKFEAWHNDFYGPQGKYNPIRSLAYDSHGVGLGYDDPTVQAQFCAFKGGQAARRAPAEAEAPSIAKTLAQYVLDNTAMNCTCSDCYTDYSMTDPQCEYCACDAGGMRALANLVLAAAPTSPEPEES